MEVLRESTRIIAEFDDRVEVACLLRIKFKKPITNPIDGATRTEWQIADTCYHESWDWLMPIVEKIGEIRQYDFDCGSSNGDINHVTIFSSKSRVYNAVIEFIQFYNEQVK